MSGSPMRDGDMPRDDRPGADLPGADVAAGDLPGVDVAAGDAGAGMPGAGMPGAGLTGRDAAGGEVPGGEDDAPARLTVWIAGHVQGVGLRWWIRERALEFGLVGSAQNLEDGRVKVIAEGPAARCRDLLALLSGPGMPGRVTGVTQRWDDPRGGLTGFAER
ncbi:MAG TPA: acylphosphatase [Streptosporangiaceae bacterium]|nr:acylphosphatase [Streptosporangiaceae bacterium]